MRDMPAPRKYPDELRERATRMAMQARRDPTTHVGAIARVGDQLGINRETLRNWVLQAEIDAGDRSGTTTDQAQRLAELERENRELRRTSPNDQGALCSSTPVPFDHAPTVGRIALQGRGWTPLGLDFSRAQVRFPP